MNIKLSPGENLTITLADNDGVIRISRGCSPDDLLRIVGGAITHRSEEGKMNSVYIKPLKRYHNKTSPSVPNFKTLSQVGRGEVRPKLYFNWIWVNVKNGSYTHGAPNRKYGWTERRLVPFIKDDCGWCPNQRNFVLIV